MKLAGGEELELHEVKSTLFDGSRGFDGTVSIRIGIKQTYLDNTPELKIDIVHYEKVKEE